MRDVSLPPESRFDVAVLVWLATPSGAAPAVTAANCRPIVRNALRVMGVERILTLHTYGDPPPRAAVTDTSR